MFEGNRRIIEAAKSLLIVLLSLSALYLAGRAFLLYEGTAEKDNFNVLSLTTAEPMGGAGISRPVRMAVMNADGRYGVQYDDAAVDELFDMLGDLLGEALGAAGTAVPVDRGAWEAALLKQGVYYDFPGVVPLTLLSAWLGEGDSVPDAQVTCLLLAAEEENSRVRLYYVDADTKDYYACDTTVQFRQRLDTYVPNGAVFAFQEERYGGLDPDTLILPNVPVPPVYEGKVGADVENSTVLESLLGALSFSPQPNAIYPAADGGWNVREAGDSLRLTREGSIYYNSGNETNRYEVPEEAGQSELVEITGELVRKAMAPYCGEARIYLDEMVQTGDDWVLTYCYALAGADVQLGREGWCARFTIRNGQIYEYVMKLRCYETTNAAAVLLPEYQAMYAMEAMSAGGRELLLRYYDGGSGTVAPSWIAR